MIGAEQLAMMKDTAVLVNTSRGQVLDPQALTEALEHKAIAAAALDVYDPEPLDEDSPLRKLDNVILNAHMASTSEESTSLVDLAIEVKRVIEGGDPANRVNG